MTDKIILPFSLDIPRMGYFIAYKHSGGIFGQGIIRKQLSAGFNEDDACYTHVEVSGGGPWSINIAPPSTKLVDITKKHKGRYIKILRYKNDCYQYKRRYKIAFFAATLCNKRYDWKGIAAFLFKWVRNDNRLYFCSEGCAWALHQVYPSAFDGRPDNKIMPADFVSSPDFELVWEGRITSF